MGMTYQAATGEAHYTEVCRAVPPRQREGIAPASKYGAAVVSQLSEAANRRKGLPRFEPWVVSSERTALLCAD